MKMYARSWKAFAFGIILLILGISIWLNILGHARNKKFFRSLSERGTVVLLPGDTAALLSDLKSGDSSRLERWKLYLSTHVQFNDGSGNNRKSLSDAYNLYSRHEKPGRSNYYYGLIFQILEEQKAAALSEEILVGALGLPDFTSSGLEGRTVQYEYNYAGRKYVASAIVSNGFVKRLDIYAP